MSAAAILFDFDGVLVESADIKQAAFAQLFADVPEPARGVVIDFLEAHPGLSRFAKFEHIHREILHQPLDAAGMAALAGRFAALVVEAVVACPAVAGSTEFLAARANEGVPMFIASATPEDELHHILARRGMDGWFRSARGSPRAKADNVGDILAELGLAGADCVMIGDADQDYRAATAHGLRFIGRVPVGAANPFPPGIPVFTDFHVLAAAWQELERIA